MLKSSSLPFERGFEKNFEYATTPTKTGKKMRVLGSPNIFESDKLLWSLSALGCDEERDFNMDPSFHFRVLDDHLAHADSRERNRLSDRLLQQVSEMAVVDDIRVALECDRTWDREARTHDRAKVKFRSDFIKYYAQTLNLSAILDRTRISSQLRVFCEKTVWPQGHNLDRKWLESADAARKQLNEVWRCFRSGLLSGQKEDGFPQQYIDDDQAAFSAADRPEILEAIEEERRAILAVIEQRESALVERDLK